MADPVTERQLDDIRKLLTQNQQSPAAQIGYNSGVFTFNISNSGLSHEQFSTLMEKFGKLESKIDLIAQKEILMAATLDDVLKDTQDQATVVGSVVTLLNGLSAQLAAAIASGDPVKVQNAADAISANTKKLADAVAANTPGGPVVGP